MEDSYFEYQKIEYEDIKEKDFLLMVFHLREGNSKEMVKVIKQEKADNNHDIWNYKMIESTYSEENGSNYWLHWGTLPNEIYRLTEDQVRLRLL